MPAARVVNDAHAPRAQAPASPRDPLAARTQPAIDEVAGAPHGRRVTVEPKARAAERPARAPRATLDEARAGAEGIPAERQGEARSPSSATVRAQQGPRARIQSERSAPASPVAPSPAASTAAALPARVEPPSVEISIGRIELRAAPAAPPRTPIVARGLQRIPSLASYLATRGER
jgi:hypothetical protein